MRTCMAAILALTFSVATAAPVPPPPKLASEMFADSTWHYEYDEQRAGVITFYRDGTYFACHNPPHGCHYCGLWSVEPAGELVLREARFCPAGTPLSSLTEFRFTLKTNLYPTLAGVSNGRVRVLLSDPKR